MKYTRQELDKAFTKVQNKINWKHPVNAIIDEKDQDLVNESIIFFTGSVPTFSKMFCSDLKPTLWVQAKGYYEAVGA